MTSFALKYLALAAMLLDHVAAVLYRCGWMGWTLKTALRCIGRLAFPIIAWQTAQSWRHTSDKYRYLQRLLLGAAVSAVPYSLTFGTAGDGTQLALSISGWQLAGALAGAAAAVYGAWMESDAKKRPGAICVTAAAALMLLFSVQVNGICLLGGRQSIFYTLAAGCIVCSLLDADETKTPMGYLWRAAVLLALVGCVKIDYDVRGIFLIAAFFLVKKPWQNAMAVLLFALWSAAYGSWSRESLIYLVGYCASLVFILTANGQRGKGDKRLFYIIYPAHLAVLGAAQVLLH